MVLSDERFELYNGDCAEVLKFFDDEVFDCVITSPPYDNLRKYNGAGEGWNYLKFQEIANQLYRTLKKGGVIVWVVNDKVENGSKSGTSFKQALYFMDLGLSLNDTMIWEKTNPMPQVKQPRYNQVFEYMFIFSKGKPKTFNPIMVPTKCGGQIYASTCKNMGGENGRKYKEFNINSEKVDSNIWKIAVAQNKTNHPAVFPLEIPLRHIKSWTNENDIILDPFMGSGTTGLASLQLNRKFVGIEIDNDYFNLSRERLKELANGNNRSQE